MLASGDAFNGTDATTPSRRARFLREAARNYLIELGYLAERICASEFDGPPPACVDYRQAIDAPSAYVDAVAVAADLRPSPGQIAAAVANIDRGLYRRRMADPAAVAGAGTGFVPLDDFYDILRAADPLKWDRLRRALPPWVFEAEPA
jgi:hypothetical protein